MTQIAILFVLVLLAIAVVVASIVYHVSEVRADEAAWDALIERTHHWE